ncbi:hypothetical protein T4E_10867 [Trichinella pseudospiralis]|uniref:Uncharacterized protein n=1 Tax=Trichinella pseudospiralis TaxID=6337 RepID=A0A0V0XD06_TRIPS|nr:hypothetical protein T4E_10867 [Trichinella pseudospiralis]
MEYLKIFTSICDGMQCEGIKEVVAENCWYVVNGKCW